MAQFILYVLVFLLACGIFSGIVACVKGYRFLRWMARGALLPVIGVYRALKLKNRRSRNRGPGAGAGSKEKKPPKRCRGSYIPDCAGCPFFQSPLFDEPTPQEVKGKCLRFRRVLKEESVPGGNRVIVETEDEAERQ